MEDDPGVLIENIVMAINQEGKKKNSVWEVSCRVRNMKAYKQWLRAQKQTTVNCN